MAFIFGWVVNAQKDQWFPSAQFDIHVDGQATQTIEKNSSQTAEKNSSQTAGESSKEEASTISIQDLTSAKFEVPNIFNVHQMQGKWYYLHQKSLWQFDEKSRQASVVIEYQSLPQNTNLSEAQKMVLERLRHSYHGFLSLEACSEDVLMLSKGGEYFVYLVSKNQLKPLALAHSGLNVECHFKNQFVSYSADGDLWVQSFNDDFEKKGQPIALSNRKGNEKIMYGEAELIAQEEMDRSYGYRWHDENAYLAYTKVDLTDVQIQKRMALSASGSQMIEQPYPSTGSANAKISLYVAEMGKVNQIKAMPKAIEIPKPEGFEYLARFEFFEDCLFVQWQTRDQKLLKLYQACAPTFKAKEILEEKSDSWVALHDDLSIDHKHLIWSSERNGTKQLFAISRDGKKTMALTSPSDPVISLAYVSQDRIYYYKSINQGLEKHLFSIKREAIGFDGTSPMKDDLAYQKLDETRHTLAPGYHQIQFLGNDRYLHRYTHLNQPYQTQVLEGRLMLDEKNQPIEAQSKAWAIEMKNEAFERLLKPKTEFKSIKTPSGEDLNIVIYYPIGFNPKHQYPVLNYVYGGPTSQVVTNQWSRQNLLWYYLAHQGYFVYSVDNRGTPNRSTAFTRAMYHQLGKVEVDDHLLAANWVKANVKGVDPHRFGIYGWSYGGYLTGLMMTHPQNPYQAGISVAPVSHWSLYDTHYTERYLGTPQAEKDLYQKSSILDRLDHFKGDLLLVHGMSDDNVLFDHSIRWMEMMQEKGINFELMTYPGAGHAINQGNQRFHLYQSMGDFLDRKLKAKRR
jgi:dipeptidyl-peptidase-4